MRSSERLAALVTTRDEIQPSTRSNALSRQPSLISFSLGLMHRLALIVNMMWLSCAFGGPKPAVTPTFFAPGALATELEANVTAIERSTPARWIAFSRLARHLDGEKGETFAVACAYLVRRDPTIFLRRHLAGDRYGILCGLRAYGWSGKEYQRVLDEVYRYRLLEAKSAVERQKIEQFIAETTKKT